MSFAIGNRAKEIRELSTRGPRAGRHVCVEAARGSDDKIRFTVARATATRYFVSPVFIIPRSRAVISRVCILHVSRDGPRTRTRRFSRHR